MDATADTRCTVLQQCTNCRWHGTHGQQISNSTDVWNHSFNVRVDLLLQHLKQSQLSFCCVIFVIAAALTGGWCACSSASGCMTGTSIGSGWLIWQRSTWLIWSSLCKCAGSSPPRWLTLVSSRRSSRAGICQDGTSILHKLLWYTVSLIKAWWTVEWYTCDGSDWSSHPTLLVPAWLDLAVCILSAFCFLHHCW